jgi:hypothetical protein
MKKKLLFSLALLVVAAVTISFTTFYPSGSPGGYTNSPLDGANCTHCHPGSASPVSNYITTDIPAEGYFGGFTYNITVSYTGSGKKGFELTCEDSNNTKVGVLHQGSGTKMTNGNHAVTHSSAQSSSTATWNFTWTAPASGTGTVTFYSALVVGEPHVKYCSLTVNESTTGINSLENQLSFKVYPNPAVDHMMVQTDNDSEKRLDIFNNSGVLCKSVKINSEQEINLNDLASGIYSVRLYDHGKTATRKLIKK